MSVKAPNTYHEVFENEKCLWKLCNNSSVATIALDPVYTSVGRALSLIFSAITNLEMTFHTQIPDG